MKAQAEKNILLILTGSIAVYKACDLISKLVQTGRYHLEIVASSAALRFVGAPLIEGLTGKKVHTDQWEAGSAMEHIHLVRWADLIVTYPASANYVNKLASGIGDSLETTLFLAHDFKAKDWWLAPAMNTLMFDHPATQKSLETLRSWGVQIVETNEGHLACGEIGRGRLQEPAAVLSRIEAHFASPERAQLPHDRGPSVIITSGGTVEAIDSVRVLTNRSTGSTGAKLAEELALSGFEVVYLYGENAKRPAPRPNIREVAFGSAENLRNLLWSELQDHEGRQNFLIHAAAVADYTPEAGAAAGKLNSNAETLTIRLRRNPKIISEVRANFPKVKIVAFKLTSEESLAARNDAISSLFQSSDADVVVHNDTTEWQWGAEHHGFDWVERAQPSPLHHPLKDRQQLAEKMIELISKNNQEKEL